MALAQAPSQAPAPIKRTPTNVLRLFADMCNCIVILSARFNHPQMGIESKQSMSMGLALIYHVFHSTLDDFIDTDFDGDFFKHVLKFLNVNDQDAHIMESIEKYVQHFQKNWEEIRNRAGCSHERKKILLFFQSLYGQDLKKCLIILKTFIGSGKTASLALLMLLSLMKGESAVYMTPSSNEVLRLFYGMIKQLEDLINSDEFRSLPKGDFKAKMIELERKLRNPPVYTQPPKFGQVLNKDEMHIFVLAPTFENFAYVLGNSRVCKMFMFDDIKFSHELARRISQDGSESTIFIAGADVEDCDPRDFPNYTICPLNIQKPIDLQKIVGDARLEQDAGFQEFIHKTFGTTCMSKLKELLTNMGINVNGSVDVPEKTFDLMDEFFHFLRLVSCDYDESIRKLDDHYKQHRLMDIHQKQNRQKIVLMQKGEMLQCCSRIMGGLFRVADREHVPKNFSCSSNTRVNVGGDIVLDVKNPKPSDSSTENKEKKKEKEKEKEKDESNSSQPLPNAVCGGGAGVAVKKKERKPSTSTKDMQEKADDESFQRRSGAESRTRPATFNDLDIDFVDDMNMCYRPKAHTISRYNHLIDSLRNVPTKIKTALKKMFAGGAGCVFRELPSIHNTFVANVFAKDELTYLSTDFPLESMNLGHVSMIILLCSISEKDLRQLLGRMNRPNSGTFHQLVEDGRLVILSLDQFYIHSQNRDGEQKTGDDSQNVPSFIEFHTQCSRLGVQVISEPILEVLRNLFRTYSDMFPRKFQVQVEKLLTTACIRCFCRKMRFADKDILDKDTAMLIGSCLGLVEKSVFPIRCLSEAESLNALYERYRTDDRDVLGYFEQFIQLLPLICAKTPSDLQALDDIEKIERVIEEIHSALDASLFASVVISMTTPIMADKKQSHRGWMSLIASILESTTTHLGKLISLLEAKLISHNESLEKSKIAVGCVMSIKKVDEFSTGFSELSKRILDGLLDGTILLSYAISLVHDFISSKRSDAPEKVIQKAQEFLKALSGFSPSMCERFKGLSQKQPILRQKLGHRELLELRWTWAASGKTSTQLLFSFLKLTPIDGIVLLATKDLMNAGNFLHHTVIPRFYAQTCHFLTKCGFLREGQCEAHVDAGNGMRKISVESFEQLKGAIQRFDEPQADDDQKFCAKIKRNQNDALIAEISVSIDALQQEVSLLLGAVSEELRELYGFTKMS